MFKNVHLALDKKQLYLGIFIFQKKSQDNSDMHLNFRKWSQVFLLSGNFGDIEFHYFSVDPWWYSGIKWVIVT